MNLRQVGLVAGYSARYSLRGGVGLVFLLLSLTFGLLVAHNMLQPVEKLAAQVEEQRDDDTPREEIRAEVLERLIPQVRPTVMWLLGGVTTRDPYSSPEDEDEREKRAAARDWADYLLVERPALLSAIFLVLLIGWPFIITVGAFDLYAGDIASRQLRYQLLRCDRPAIFVGRLVGSVAVFIAVLLLLGATVVTYIGIKLPHYGLVELLLWAGYGVLALIVVSLPYLALSAWISAAIASSFTALTILSLIIGGVPLFAMVGRMQWESATYVNWVLPWGFQMHLFDERPLHVLLAAGGCLAQTALFFWLGFRKFTRRDL